MVVVGLLKFTNIYLTLYFILFRVVLSKDGEVYWPAIIKHQLFDKVKPYQVTIITDGNNTKNNDDYDYIFKDIIKEVPGFTTYFEALNISNILNTSSSTRSITFCIILHSWIEDSVEIVESIVDVLSKFYYNLARPKSLLILFNDSAIDSLISAILHYAWSKKFVDFSILEVKKNNVAFLHHYNPFIDEYIKIPLTSETVIFPEKLRNAHGYPLKMLGMYFPPYMNLSKANEWRGINLDEINYPLILLAAEALNFTVKYLHGMPGTATISDVIRHGKEHFKVDDINVLLLPTLMNYRIPHSEYVPLEYYSANMVALVPIISIDTFNAFYRQIFFRMFLFVASTVVVAYFMQVVKIKREIFKLFDIIQIFFGVAVISVPKKLVNRILFISFVVNAMYFSNEFYSQIVDISLTESEVSFDTLRGIDKSNIQPYLNKKVYDVFFVKTENYYIKKLVKKAIDNPQDNECIDKLRRKERAICIMLNIKAEHATKKYLENGKPIMKIAKPILSQDLMVYKFEQSSPYARSLQKVFRAIYESGIWNQIARYHKFMRSLWYVKKVGEKTSTEKRALVLVIVMILCFGYLASCAVFLGELILHKWKRVARKVYDSLRER